MCLLPMDLGERPYGIIANGLDCVIIVSKSEQQLHYYIHFQTNTFGKGMNPLILPSWLGLYNTPTASRQRGNESSGYDIKQSSGKVLVMLELWRMWNTPSLTSLPGPLCSGVVAPEWVLSMGQIEINCVLMLN